MCVVAGKAGEPKNPFNTVIHGGGVKVGVGWGVVVWQVRAGGEAR